MGDLIDVGMNCLISRNTIAYVLNGIPQNVTWSTAFFPEKVKCTIYDRNGRTYPCYITVEQLYARVAGKEDHATPKPGGKTDDWHRGYNAGYKSGEKRAHKDMGVGESR